MSEPKNNELKLVTFAKERQNVLEALAFKAVVVSGDTAARAQVQFNVDRVDGSNLYLLAHENDTKKLGKGGLLVLAFSLNEGQYFIRGDLRHVTKELFVIAITETNLFRLQRRDNFRAQLSEKLRPKLTLKSGIAAGQSVHAVDVSANGIGFLIDENFSFSIGSKMQATLTIDAQTFEIELAARHQEAIPNEKLLRVGAEILDLDANLKRELLALALKIHREMLEIFRDVNR